MPEKDNIQEPEETQAVRVAKAIAEALFRGAGPEKATHLCMFQGGHDGRYLAGWCEDAVVTEITKVLSAQPALELTGCAEFGSLCADLIDDENMHWLYPKIHRTRSSDWCVWLRSHPDGNGQSTLLAAGQHGTLDGACKAAVSDFHARRQLGERKALLLEDPKVREALELFGCKVDKS
jgi:hypothetical protein